MSLFRSLQICPTDLTQSHSCIVLAMFLDWKVNLLPNPLFLHGVSGCLYIMIYSLSTNKWNHKGPIGGAAEVVVLLESLLYLHIRKCGEVYFLNVTSVRILSFTRHRHLCVYLDLILHVACWTSYSISFIDKLAKQANCTSFQALFFLATSLCTFTKRLYMTA